MDLILEARDLTIGYRGRRVGEDLGLGLAPGRALALLGPNGGGKTTLLKTLLGLIPPLAGEVLLEGRPLAATSIRERARRLAYVPQVHAGTFGFSVFEVVLMGRTAHGSAFAQPSARDQAVARETLDRLGIAHLADRAYTLISGGERQLALIARALAQEPRAIVLDEPTASLDFGNQGHVLSEIRALTKAGLGVLFTTHDPNQAARCADDVLMIRDGRVLASGPAADALTADRLRRLYGSEIEVVADGQRAAFLPHLRRDEEAHGRAPPP